MMRLMSTVRQTEAKSSVEEGEERGQAVFRCSAPSVVGVAAGEHGRQELGRCGCEACLG